MRFRKEKEADEKYTVKVSDVIVTLPVYLHENVEYVGTNNTEVSNRN